ncbi:MAG: hypothetical protein GQ533_14300 [Methanosarcinaceae archaeon]|nr:hypothetical protein [Methanosarcinaceae archaeon]
MEPKETGVKEEVCVLIRVKPKYTIEFIIMMVACQELCNRYYKSKKLSKIDEVFSVLGPFDVFLELSEQKYLFSWDEVPGKDSKRFLEFLKDDIKICCAKKSEIKKSEDKKTITVSNMVTLTIDNENEKVTIKKMGEECTPKCISKKEYNMLNIYKKKINKEGNDGDGNDEYTIHERINKTIFGIRETLGSYVYETHTLTKFELSEFLNPTAKELYYNPHQIYDICKNKDFINFLGEEIVEKLCNLRKQDNNNGKQEIFDKGKQQAHILLKVKPEYTEKFFIAITVFKSLIDDNDSTYKKLAKIEEVCSIFGKFDFVLKISGGEKEINRTIFEIREMFGKMIYETSTINKFKVPITKEEMENILEKILGVKNLAKFPNRGGEKFPSERHVDLKEIADVETTSLKHLIKQAKLISECEDLNKEIVELTDRLEKLEKK